MSKLKECPLYSMFRKLRKKIRECLFKSLFIFPMQKKIVFISYLGTKVNCNPKFIYDELKRRNIDCDLIWAVTEPDEYNFRCVKYKSLAFYYHLATAKIRISNTRLFSHWPKRKEQLYIQAWHGGIALKKVEKDAIDSLPKQYIENAINDAEKTDLMISNSKWQTKLFRRAFWYDGEILECGIPREDIYKKDCGIIKKKVYEYYSLDINNDKILLYAPTFRNNEDMSCYDLNFSILKNALQQKYGGRWIILARMHPNVQKYHLKNNTDVINVTSYDEINELIIASEILITDYSSCMFDGLLAQKKVVLYANDINNYVKDRGFYMEFSNLPFELAIKEDELIDIINNFDENEYAKKCTKFKNNVGIFEYGNASKTVVDWIENNIKK